jgi:hypothetical protein
MRFEMTSKFFTCGAMALALTFSGVAFAADTTDSGSGKVLPPNNKSVSEKMQPRKMQSGRAAAESPAKTPWDTHHGSSSTDTSTGVTLSSPSN